MNGLIVKNNQQVILEDDDCITKLDIVHGNLADAAYQLQNKLPEIIEFAQASQHPKVYESLAKIITALSIINRDTANVIKQKYDIIQSNKIENKTIINNSYTESNTIKMSANDMLDLIRKKSEENI